MRSWLILAGVVALLALVGTGAFESDAPPPGPEPAAGGAVSSEGRASGGAAVEVRAIRVVDGDTIRIRGERVRIRNIDAPELGDGARCRAERLLAERARDRAREMISGAGEVRIVRSGQDQYGRTLADLSVDGQDFGRAMIDAGLARPWRGRREDWCG